jgi:WhiB family transcriptional regulator, redox-sensing transcriptional regulator
MTHFPNDALCRTGGYDPELWFPLTDEAVRPALYREAAVDAKAICAQCPVRAACLEFGMDIPFGIFGGHTPEERRVIRERRAARKFPARV